MLYILLLYSLCGRVVSHEQKWRPRPGRIQRVFLIRDEDTALRLRFSLDLIIDQRLCLFGQFAHQLINLRFFFAFLLGEYVSDSAFPESLPHVTVLAFDCQIFWGIDVVALREGL